ncbi:hypothetical protein COT42_04555 [Candidatus Saganbacteria bacterium CG08_land_8_20_14_0_20_45_16]|uniref:Uncharacterized protein n=1 Tax=Candidatus Saganbacteria bacterium CG08_land_8_20_14_0_20_45_16 TaxID=2014293 RepID=A0A2H0XXT1_UNCSA|nr:MAG: hypothetical protein COT42_04555 [Candidatus Saganbacteria bacterium CG08_land_8_20_14_0_20_45_16]
MRYILVLALIFTLSSAPVLASTLEASSAPNYWQEFDITLFQTFPFAFFWSHFLERQFASNFLPNTEPHWNAIYTLATVISIFNAGLHAAQVVDKEKSKMDSEKSTL